MLVQGIPAIFTVQVGVADRENKYLYQLLYNECSYLWDSTHIFSYSEGTAARET